VKDVYLSISIVVYELDEPVLTQCLKSLETTLFQCKQANRLSSWSLTIVDNGSNGALMRRFHSDNIDIIENAKNVGYGAAHNQTIMSRTSDFHLILNPDVILDPDYVYQSLKLMARHSDVVLAGPRAKTSHGTNAPLCKGYPSQLALGIRGLGWKPVLALFKKLIARYEYHDLPESKFSEVELLSGCCMLARTREIKLVGGFDDRFFLYFEDFDLSIRMREVGRVVFVPASTIVHFGGNSAAKGLKHIKFFFQSAARFFHKHGWKIV